MSVAALALCCAGCDDTWDEHYDAPDGVSGSAEETLWEQVIQNPQLANFAAVCESAMFRTSENNKPNGYSFANLLGKPTAEGVSSNVTFTLFVPQLSDEQRDSLLALIEAGKEWQVQTQFLANHIRRNRLEIVGSKDEYLYMLNSKRYRINCADSTFSGVKIKTPNIQAANGVIHILDGIVPFLPNMHEYLRAIVDENEFANFVVAADSSYFDMYNSIEGDPDEYGRITYIDSVFNVRNRYFSRTYASSDETFSGFWFDGLGDDVTSEDSAFAMIIPNNDAYNEILEKLRKYYRYAETYENNTKRNDITSTSSAANREVTYAIPNAYDKDDAEKLPKAIAEFQELQAQSALMRYLLYNMNRQYNAPKGTQTAVIEAFDTWKETVDPSVGFLNIAGDTLRSLPFHHEFYKMQYYPETDKPLGINWEEMISMWNSANFDCTSIFGSGAPIRMSNGLVYMVDKFNIDPLLMVHNDIKVEAESGVKYQASASTVTAAASVGDMSLLTDSMTDLRGRVSNGYLTLNASGNGKKEFTLKLPRVLSAKYDIYVVTVPECYNKANDPRQATFTAKLNYRGEDEIIYGDSKKCNYMTKVMDCDPIVVDTCVHTYLLFKDFEFPYSYAGLTNSYPTITFEIEKPKNTKLQTNNLCIDFIYLKAKPDRLQTETDEPQTETDEPQI